MKSAEDEEKSDRETDGRMSRRHHFRINIQHEIGFKISVFFVCFFSFKCVCPCVRGVCVSMLNLKTGQLAQRQAASLCRLGQSDELRLIILI